jgi:hypothetical protein
MVIARTASRGSTGMVQDKPLSHPARHVVRGGTGWEQEDPVKHPARPVPRTRSRLPRALLRPPAFVLQASVATPAQEHAQRVLQASTNLQQAIVSARTAARASTGLQQDKALKHPALHAARASTGWKQEDPVKHRARLVPRTRSRLLRALQKPPAFVMQATRAPPAQEHVQRALRANTNLQQGAVIAWPAALVSTGMLQDKALKHPAGPAVRASTGPKQEDPLKHLAWLASWASTGWKQEDPVKHPARPVP